MLLYKFPIGQKSFQHKTEIKDPSKTANHMNHYFSKIDDKLSNRIDKLANNEMELQPNKINTITIRPTNTGKIKRIIDEIKIKKEGIDEIK